MTPLSHLAARDRQRELMDDPGLDDALHVGALRGLARINRISAVANTLEQVLAGVLAVPSQRPLRVLDVACGGGDVAIALAQWARRHGLDVELSGCDRSPFSVAYARRRAEREGVGVAFFELDVGRDALPEGYDVVSSSLFLHHLDSGAAVAFLRELRRTAGRLVVVNDLVRGTGGLLLAALATRVLTRSPVVHVDGPRSVRAAFTVAEVRRMAADAGLADARIDRCWPFRFVLTWRRP